METKKRLVEFTPKQQEASAAADEHKYTLFGGARGPGKSFWLRWYLLSFVSRCHAMGIEGVTVGLFCEDYPALKDRQISKIDVEFPRSIGEVKESKTHGLGFHFHKGGGVIALRNLDDPSKYQSAEFAAIGVDELTKNTVDTFNLLRGSLRWPGITETRFIAATNPGGVGHLWARAYWGIQQAQQLPDELQREASQFAFVKALPDDNSHLDPSYWQMLETLPPELAKAWRWGDWSIFAGQVFGEFVESRHVIDPVVPPAHWRRLRGVDWGRVSPFCCLWAAQDPDTGRVIIYKEAYKTGLTDRDQARLITVMSTDNERVTFADPSMWTKKTMEDKTFSTADEYLVAGVPLTRADNDRLTGWRKLHTMLTETAADGLPLLQFTRNCANLIRTLPALPRDNVNIEDVDTQAEDHAPDALRYLLTPVNPRPVAKSTEYKPPHIDRLIRLSHGGNSGLRISDL